MADPTLADLKKRLADWRETEKHRQIDRDRRQRQETKAERRVKQHPTAANKKSLAGTKARLTATQKALNEARKAITKLRAAVARRSVSPRDKALHWARTHLRHVEHPAGSNREPGKDGITAWEERLAHWLIGAPWCGVFTGNALRAAGVHVPAQVASVAWVEDAARGHQSVFTGWGSPAHAKPGDIVILFGRGIHQGLVESVHNGYLVTLEGNTSFGSSGSQSNGGCSTRRTRPFSVCRGIAHVRY